MRYLLMVAFLLVACHTLVAQDTTAIRDAVDRFEQALVERKAEVIRVITHKHLRFGHSNGWVQTRQDVLSDMQSGVLEYRSFTRESLTIERIGKMAYVKERVDVRGVARGTAFQLKLFVLQQWVKTKKGWQLQMRQSAKLG